MARLFFALWPDDAAVERLSRLAEGLAQSAGGKAVPAAKIHLTIAFLGEVGAHRIDDARAAAAIVDVPGFRLTVDIAGSFAGARVAWAGASSVPRALAGLESNLAAQLRQRGFEFEARPFVPHLTLSRKIARPFGQVPIEPIAWDAVAVALVRSESGTGRYTTLEAWALGKTVK